MSERPWGTISLLFSDIEGSTRLLSRLGPSYVDALDGHRQVLRAAWAAHGGTELGTEGDSFFVVFRTAAAAVRAAAQAQRGLADYPWPGGEPVRVRMGIHTGSPQLHGDSYVGMDVHRAARIAGAAHGGQVVLSAVTAELAASSLPDGVALRDLGSHRLKDIAVAEHLFQLTIDGLQAEFSALKTVGAASSLPLPTTPLVGRDAEVAELAALLESPGVRLVTLTGPGGSGKTRLAIAVAQQLVDAFPDGVFFVPLASVTSADVMWTSIAEALDVPPKSRTPPELFDYVAQRSALLVLDNLEQLPQADEVVAQLLNAGPRVVVLASSRRALSVPAEHRHPVPPLSLPDDSTVVDAESFGAVQLFVQRARSVRPSFALTDDNVGDVVAICRHLDGLPLALELSAARIRLLNPKALLRRLDQTLDMATHSKLVPIRQKTLRDTIAWSHDLLTPAQQVFFRRLGAFAGGAALDALSTVTAVPGDLGHGGDPLDRVADLVDASLATITEGPDGEPRLAMLETIRAYAREQMLDAGEIDAVRTAHAAHYVGVAEQLQSLRETQHLLARDFAEIELDNFREALGWTLQTDIGQPTDPGVVRIGRRLCFALGWLWWIGGYLFEGRRWFEQAIGAADESPSRELAACLGGLANLLLFQGEPRRALDVATKGLTMARTLGDEERIASALGLVGTAQLQVGDADAARRTLQEALELHRGLGNPGMLARTLGNLAGIEEARGDFDRAEALTLKSLNILQDLGDVHEAAIQGQNLANLYALMGRTQEAKRRAESLVATVLQLRNPNLTAAFANTYLNILIRLDDPVRAAHLFGAEEAMRERNAMPNPHQAEELQEIWSLVAGRISSEAWERHCQLGRGEALEDLLAQLGKE